MVRELVIYGKINPAKVQEICLSKLAKTLSWVLDKAAEDGSVSIQVKVKEDQGFVEFLRQSFEDNNQVNTADLGANILVVISFCDEVRILVEEESTEEMDHLLARPISDLNLSVRARKGLVRLQVETLVELVEKTEDELLEINNFGVTSLNEVREKLLKFGLKLKGDQR